MGPGFFILAIMGCGDGAAMCEQVAREDTVYSSEAACFAASDEVLLRESIRPFPLLMAECHNVRPQTAFFWGNRES